MAQNYDPMTGLPIQPMPPSASYDPMGNPLVPNMPVEDPRLDVMNNPFLTPEEKLLYSSMNNPYDAQAGNPYVAQPANPYVAQPANPYVAPANPYVAPAVDPYAAAYGSPDGGQWMAPPPKKHRKGRIILLIVLFVVLTAGVLFYFLYWNNPRVVMQRATKKTLSDGGYLTDALGKYKPAKIQKGLGIEYDIKIEQDGVTESLEGLLACDGSAAQFVMDGVISGPGLSSSKDTVEIPIDVEAEINKSEILLNMEPLAHRTIVYDYTSDDYGCLDDKISQEKLNEGIKELYDFFVKGKLSSTLKKAKKDAAKIAKNTKYESISSKTFEVDGKDRKCKGYKMTESADNMVEYFELFADYYEERFDGLIKVDGGDEEVMEVIRTMKRSLRESARNTEDLEICYWLYKGEFACVEIDDGNSTYSIRFLGGDFRMQNIEIYEDKELIASIEGERDGDEDVFYLYEYDKYGDSSEAGIITYDKSTGELLIENPDDSSNYLSFVIESDKNYLNIDVDMCIDDGVSVKGSVQICNNPQLYEIEINDPLNLDSASESEMEEFGDECEENMMEIANEIAGDVEFDYASTYSYR